MFADTDKKKIQKRDFQIKRKFLFYYLYKNKNYNEMGINFKDFKLPEGVVRVSNNVLRASDNKINYYILRQLTRDGVPIHGVLENPENMPYLHISRVGEKNLTIIMYPQLEEFIIRYLLAGIAEDYPKDTPGNYEIPDNIYTGDDYIYKHILREIARNDYECWEEEKDGIKGLHFKANYPYGSIDYGFIPHTQEEMFEILSHTEPFIMETQPCDIPELNNTELATEQVYIKESQRLSDIFPDGIPANTIIDKTVCGIGATYLEIHTDRDSIIIEPNVPVIIGKMQQHRQIIGVFSEKIKQKDIADKVRNTQGHVKIMTTPDSYNKVTAALKSIGIDYKNSYFLLFDECEKLVSDIDYRPNMALPISDFFKFTNKAMVSATPIVVNDPRFTEQGFKIIKVRPEYDHKQVIELKPTNNVNAMLRKTLERIGDEPMKCIFYNSVTGIRDLIDYLGIVDKSNIYCSTESSKELKRSGYNVYDSITDSLNKYNFFTSRFYSAVDIVLVEKPVVIMLSNPYKTVDNKTPYSLIDPETESIQIMGRFRNGIDRLIHITSTSKKLQFNTREELEYRLEEEYQCLEMIGQLCDDADTIEKHDIFLETIKRMDICQQGFADYNGTKNYFRYNNAYLDERLKMLYTYPARLYKAYERSGAFTVFSASEYAMYTEEEREKLKDKNSSKAERITLLYNLISRSDKKNKDWFYFKELLDDIRNDYALYLEAFSTIGYAKVKELDFVDSDIKTAVNNFKLQRDIKKPEVKQAVYGYFKENTFYPTSEIKSKLAEIYDKTGVQLHRQPKGGDICIYFEATETHTEKVRGWNLGKKLE